MRVLVATKAGQGKRKTDFCWADEGELVNFGFECDGETVDGSCGCRRSMSGFETFKATTTFKVEDRNITREDFIRALVQSLKKAGWLTIANNEKLVRDTVAELLTLAKSFPVGKVLERRGDKIQVR